MNNLTTDAWAHGVDDVPTPKRKAAPGKKGGSSDLVVRIAVDTLSAADLQGLAGKIKAERDDWERSSLDAANHLIRLGELLDDARKAIGRGGWLAWIESNCSMSRRSVYNYLAIASAVRTGKLNVATVANLSVKAALKLIAESKSEPKPAVAYPPAPLLPAPAPQVPPVENVSTETDPQHQPANPAAELRKMADDLKSELPTDQVIDQPADSVPVPEVHYVPPAPPIDLLPGVEMPVESKADMQVEPVVEMQVEIIHAYISELGYICIKQLDWRNEDQIISIRPRDLPALVARLTELAGER